MFPVSVEGFFTKGFPEVKMNYLAQLPSKLNHCIEPNYGNYLQIRMGCLFYLGPFPLPVPVAHGGEQSKE